MSTARRAVVTGIGVITPAGITVPDFWSAVTESRSGIRPIRSFDATPCPVRLAGEIAAEAFRAEDYVKERKPLKLMGRAAQFALAASVDACRDAGLADAGVAPERLGVSLGVHIGDVGLGDIYAAAASSERGGDDARDEDDRGADGATSLGEAMVRELDPYAYLRFLPNLVAAHLAIFHDARGPNAAYTTLSAASLTAIGEAAATIRRGEADAMLAGGADSWINPYSIFAADVLGTLLPPAAEACRPFDARHAGLVPGEGAAVLVLENAVDAAARGARVYGEVGAYECLVGGAAGGDESLAEAIAIAQTGTRRSAAGVDAVIAHGSGCPALDRAESTAFARASRAAPLPPITSVKSIAGHLAGAAGAVNVVAALLSIRDGCVPPIANFERPEAGDTSAYVSGEPLHRPVETVLTTSLDAHGPCAAMLVHGANGNGP